jgi:TolA-binding protein
MYSKLLRFSFIIFFVSTFICAHAQQTIVNTIAQQRLQIASELFYKQKYAAAQKAFDEICAVYSPNTEEHAEAMYFAANCALELFNADAETRMQNFINLYPGSKRIKMAYFSLGNLEYRAKSFRDALNWYEKINERDFHNKEHQYEYQFKKGYCYFLRNEYDKAKLLFNDIMDIENNYAAPATYYYSHIAYSQGNLETALNGFQKFKPGSPFYPTVPYYIAHIYYMQKKFPELIDFAEPWLDSANVKRAPELAHLIGDAYFRMEKYTQALPYLNKFFDKGAKPEREDFYQLAYCFYKTKNYTKAIDNYKKVIGKTDSLNQLAYYQLANSYLQISEKQLARNSYEVAAKDSFYSDLAEDALFSYAKLSYELAYNPYHEAIDAFDKYIQTYPDSPRLDEAFRYMVNVYLTTKNYKEALVSIEKIKKRTLDMEFAYQKISYYRAIEFFNDRDYSNAKELFKKAVKIGKDKKINAISMYWIADACYRQEKFDDAMQAYQEFNLYPGAALNKEFAFVNYNIGYCYFKKQNYTEAAVAFRKFTSEKNDASLKMKNDAFVRIGDCYFMKSDYNKAIEFYSEAIKINLFDIDYALFQKASALGLLAKTEDKIAALDNLLNKYPKSNYADDALFEIGNAFMQKENYTNALSYFDQLQKGYPKSSYIKKALLKTALANFNMDKNDVAIALYKDIIAKYPSSEEAKESVTSMRNIYVETGDVASFERYVKNQSGLNYSNAAIDSATYEAAELRFMKGDCEHAVVDFRNYISKFQNGFFLLNANYYMAECAAKTNPDVALTGYNYVIQQNKNKFTENALYKAANLSFKKKDYQSALGFYESLLANAETPANILEAKTGMMRCASMLLDYAKAIEFAGKVIVNAKVSNELLAESYLTRGKAASELGNDSLAIGDLIKTSSMSQAEFGAQAHYFLAELYHKRKNYPEAEKTIFELADRIPSYDYWIAKGFLLLAKNYHAMADDFQAKETFKSIIDKCEIPALVKEAQESLNAINAEEELKNKVLVPEETEIKFDVPVQNESEIFDSPIVPEPEKKNDE